MGIVSAAGSNGRQSVVGQLRLPPVLGDRGDGRTAPVPRYAPDWGPRLSPKSHVPAVLLPWPGSSAIRRDPPGGMGSVEHRRVKHAKDLGVGSLFSRSLHLRGSKMEFGAVAVALSLLNRDASGRSAGEGDTIEMDAKRRRLWGIDAPEMHSACAGGWPAGLEANHHARTDRRRAVACELRGPHRYTRSIWPMSSQRSGSGRGDG